MKARIRELPNGVRLAVIRNRNLNSMAVLAGVQVGSRHEPMGLWGAAHFVEHVLFKGTKRRPSAKVISQEIESLGGDHNAFTDKEMTGFHVHISKHHGRTAVDVVHDTLTGALLRSSDIEKERPVIREEISMYENNPDMGVWHLSEDVAYKGTGLKHRITGKSVSFSPTMLRDFFRSWYSPERTVVALAGAVDDDTEKLAADLIATRGSPKPFRRSTRSVFTAPVGRHSAKPDAFYELVAETWTGPYAELFARRRRGPEWSCFGNELPDVGAEAAE